MTINTWPTAPSVPNPMVDMMGPVLVEAFGATFASKDDVARLEIKVDELLETTRLITAALAGVKERGGMLAKLLGLD